MIIVEGADGGGKSTLVRELSARLNVPIHHSGGPAITRDEIFSRLGQLYHRMHRDEIFLMDRIPIISDCVYGPILRSWTPFHELNDGETYEELYRSQLLTLLRIPIIYCRPPMAVLIENAGRPQPEKANRTYAQPKSAEYIDRVRHNAPMIACKYDVVMGDYPHWTYDYTRTNSSIHPDQLAAMIGERLHLNLI